MDLGYRDYVVLGGRILASTNLYPLQQIQKGRVLD